MNFHKWLQRRECGMRPNFGDRDFIMKRVYNSIESYKCWNDLSDIPNTTSEWGAVFNLEFSPEGNVLVAACEKKSILLFDAITTKETYKIPNAHMDNVNCIRFLNPRMFASCSDDTTVALWDLRNLKSKVRSLHGHSNWVKNIEYSHKDNLLVTSGFDGSIFTWDINSHTEQGLIYQKVFHTSGLMRCRIAPDGTKLVICTTGGYLMIIHSLDLTTLHEDLCGFRPTIYRLMQMGHQYIPQAAKFDHVFSKKQKRNRVELVTDFPAEDDAEVILALQIHPMGHSFLSRNISYDEQTEWSCVHDLNEEPDDITESVGPPSTKRKRKLTMTSDEELHPDEENINAADLMLVSVNRRARNQRSYPILSGRTAPPPPPPPPLAVGFQLSSRNANAQPIRPEPFMPDIWAAEVTMQERAERQNRARNSNTNSVTGYNYVYAISSGVLPAAATTTTTTSSTVATTTGAAASSGTTQHCTRNRRSSVNTSNNNNNSNDSVGSSSSSSSSSTSSSSDNVDVVSLRPRSAAAAIAALTQHNLQQQQHEREIYQNPKKLMYFIQESNKGKGFIKEPCFSSDGRIVCSPYDMGVRLLGFSEDCSEYPYHQHLRGRDHLGRRIPKKLHVVKQINSHSEIVLCTKFSPREPLLVTGCRNGQIVWHHPNL